MTRISSNSIIQHHWIVENHLLKLSMPEILTTAALQDNDAEILTLLDESSSSFVHLLIDARPLRVYPSLADYLALRGLKHPHVGWCLTVGVEKQPLLRFFLTTVTSAARVRYRDFDTMPEAFAFARTIDAALVDLPFEN